jgi:hypothetical protein
MTHVVAKTLDIASFTRQTGCAWGAHGSQEHNQEASDRSWIAICMAIWPCTCNIGDAWVSSAITAAVAIKAYADTWQFQYDGFDLGAA